MTTPAGARGFLFSDLRGYTAFVEAHGDQAAAEVLATYRSVVRDIVRAHAGAEVKTEGDSFYVVFPSASSALETAVEIVRAVAAASTRERPINVGIGVHAGETVETSEGLVGGAVNIAARVCAKARAGEVLVTDTVRALTRTYLSYRYTSLGRQRLKGVRGGIGLHRVEITDAGRIARLQRQLSARRGRVAAAVALAAILVSAGVAIYAVNRPPECISVPKGTKDVVVRVDPQRLCVTGVVAAGNGLGFLVPTSGALWVISSDQTVRRLDPPGVISSTVGIPGSPRSAVAAPDGSLYVLTDRGYPPRPQSVVRYDPATGGQTGLKLLADPDPVGVGYTQLAYYGDSIWAMADGDNVTKLVPAPGRLDPELKASTFRLEKPFKGPVGTTAAGVWAVWNGDSEQRLLDFSETGLQRSAVLDDHALVFALDATPAAIWMTRQDGWLTRYDVGSGVVSSFEVMMSSVSSLDAALDTVWFASDGYVGRFDVASGTAEKLKLGGFLTAIAVGSDAAVWVSIGQAAY